MVAVAGSGGGDGAPRPKGLGRKVLVRPVTMGRATARRRRVREGRGCVLPRREQLPASKRRFFMATRREQRLRRDTPASHVGLAGQ